VIERALELASGYGPAEITFAQGRSTRAEYEDDRLKQVGVAQGSHLGVRVIVDGRLGRASATDPREAEAVVARAVELAEFGSEVKFDFPGSAVAPQVKTYDPEVERTPKAELVAAGAEMLALVKAYNAEIKVGAGASWSVGERRLVNSSGLDLSDRGSRFTIGVGGVLVRGTDILFAGHGRDWRTKGAAPREVAARAIAKFRLAERTADVASKPMPVIFTPAGSFVLLASLLMGVNGKNVLKGDSPLAGRLGDEIAAPGFSLSDNATVDYAPASGAYDDEGTPRRKVDIITGGRLASFLYDLETASKAGAQSTGHGRGGGASNLVIAPGDTSLAELVKGTAEGLLVDSVMGLGQSNIMNGDFSVNVSLGYKIEQGEIVGRVKNTMFAGNVYDALMRVEAVGSEPEWIGSLCAPPLLVGALSVVAQK